MKLVVAIAAGLALALACAPCRSAAQEQSFSDFVAPVNSQGHPPQPEDRRVSENAVGTMQPFRGWTWWQTLAFCIGTHSWESQQLEKAGDLAGAGDLTVYFVEQFENPAVNRLVSDRGISEDEAWEILLPDVNLQMVEFAFAGPEERPFSREYARCRSIAANHARLVQAGAR